MVARHMGLAAGLAQLGVDLGLHVVDAVHEMHGSIASIQLPFGAPRPSLLPARPIYAAVRAGFHLAHASIGSVGRLLPPGDREEQTYLLSVRSAVNGVFGQRLAETGNPLALPMTLQRPRPASGCAGAPTLLFLHGLCMNDLAWQRGAHPEFVAKARTRGRDVAYLRYNTGLRISRNGAELAQLIEREPGDGPLWLIGHSMGGLVACSALHQAREAGRRWPERVRALVTLGAPHDGAALERIGNHANRLLRVSPYTAPLSRLGNLRSDGIRDLRHGNLLEADWKAVADPDHLHDPRAPLPLASGIAHVFVAATRSAAAVAPYVRLSDDRLVSVPSALALARNGDAPAERHVLAGLDHMGLLASRRVHALLEPLLD
jgi:pimeloyl-ACP methyl ester carboxylesterase